MRQKPEITAADGVNTSLADFAPFFGTSASAPHAAAIAALVLSGNPGATGDDIREAFAATALDLVPAGYDGRTGHGVIRADRVLEYTGATPQPLVRAGTPSVTPVTGDGDAFLGAGGERRRWRFPAANVGDGTATGVSVTATTSGPRGDDDAAQPVVRKHRRRSDGVARLTTIGAAGGLPARQADPARTSA